MKYDCSLLDVIIITGSVALSSGTPLPDMKQEAMKMLPDDRELARMLARETYYSDDVEHYRVQIAKTCNMVNSLSFKRNYTRDDSQTQP